MNNIKKRNALLMDSIYNRNRISGNISNISVKKLQQLNRCLKLTCVCELIFFCLFINFSFLIHLYFSSSCNIIIIRDI